MPNPTTMRETLAKFYDHFTEHLIGQLEAKEALLAAMYPTEDEIRQAFGDTLYSRFYDLIQPKPLTKDKICEIIDRLVDDRFSKLSEDERERLTLSELKTMLYTLADRSGNVHKLVDEAISLVLVHAALSEVPKADDERRMEGAT